VLGIDNIIFISVLVDKLAARRAASSREGSASPSHVHGAIGASASLFLARLDQAG